MKIILLLLPLYLIASNYPPANFVYEDTLLKYERECQSKSKFEQKCCMSSVNNMRHINTLKKEDILNCQHWTMNKCMGSFRWCTDKDSYQKFEKEYYK